MKSLLKTFATALVMFLSFGGFTSFLTPESSAATCVLKSVSWDITRAGVGESAGFTVVGQDCQTWGVAIQLWKYNTAYPDTYVADIGGDNHFPANSSTFKAAWGVSNHAGDWTGDTAYYLVAKIGGSGTGTEVSSQNTGGSGNYLYIRAGGETNGGATINFDVNPKQAAENKTESLQYTFGVTVAKPDDLKKFCHDGILVAVVKAGSDVIRAPNGLSAEVNDQNFAKLLDGTTKNYKFDFAQNYKFGSSSTINFQAGLLCGNPNDPKNWSQLTTSSLVAVKVGTGGTTGATGNMGTTSNTGTTGNTGTTNTQSYTFSVPNWLVGGPDSITGLINIITTWLFNISIPIAVIFIIYAGVLYLTSRGNPGTVKKAGDILKNVALGLAIIFIGKGFITLIKSVLELGGTQSNTPAQTICVKGHCTNGYAGTCTTDAQCKSGTGNTGTTGTTTAKKGVGGLCAKDSDCQSSLKCNNTVCQRSGGNGAGEACLAGSNCAQSLNCDSTSAAQIQVDGRILGTCFQSTGKDLGYKCSADSDCKSIYVCSTAGAICTKPGGNQENDVCNYTSDCQSGLTCRGDFQVTVDGQVLGKCKK